MDEPKEIIERLAWLHRKCFIDPALSEQTLFPEVDAQHTIQAQEAPAKSCITQPFYTPIN